MFRFETLPDLRLSAGQLMCWHQHHEVRLLVISGRLWVTRYDDAEDHFLAPGESIRLCRGQRAWVGAEAAACVRIERVDAPRWSGRARQITTRLLGLARADTAEWVLRRVPATVP